MIMLSAIVFFLLGMFTKMFAQNTIGLLSINSEKVSDGYSLFYPNYQADIFLINNCGELVKKWEGQENNKPGFVAYLSEDGKLLKASNNGFVISNSFGGGGAGGLLEIVDWDGVVEWSYVLADEFIRQHHDVHLLPNGNVLALVWERYLYDDIVNAGFDISQFEQTQLWCDAIYEINPSNDSIEWIWRSWDHLIQDFDSDKENFGVIAEHPERININYQNFSARAQDWMHTNSIDYNEELDQILVSVRAFNELWIIDHSTSTEEAADTIGGFANKGGDLLYRWGNPEAYGMEGERKCFMQHDAGWIDDFVDDDNPNKDEIIFFNNNVRPATSLGHSIKQIWDPDTRSYLKDEDGTFLPKDYSKEFSHVDTVHNFSSRASSVQMRDNGNVILCAANQGRVTEVNSEGEVVWEYIVPLINGFPSTQGSTLGPEDNFTFHFNKYPEDYAAFDQRDLEPMGYIELQADESYCEDIDTEVSEIDGQFAMAFYPNPSSDGCFNFGKKFNHETNYYLFDPKGQVLETGTIHKEDVSICIDNRFESGVYFLYLDHFNINQKIILIK